MNDIAEHLPILKELAKGKDVLELGTASGYMAQPPVTLGMAIFLVILVLAIICKFVRVEPYK